MTILEWKNKLREFFQARPGASFAEISHHFPESHGEHSIGMPEKNIFFWFGLSPEITDAISEMSKDGEIKVKPTEFLVYLVDGGFPRNVPMAKRNRVYKNPHWLPVTISLIQNAPGR